MASLFNTKISDTYPGLIKTLDNAAISASLKELTDGSGNQSGLFINTAGDFKASGILEFGSLKDTGENITITKFVDEADGIANNDNDTTIPTSAAVVDYVASKITLEDLDFSGDSGNGSVDLDSQTFAIVGTTNEIETTANNQQLQIGLPSSISVNLVGDVTGTITTTSILADGVTATTQSSNDNSTKVATTAYVDAQVTAEDLDFGGDTGTGSVDLDSQSLSITGTTNQVTTSATNQTLNISLPATVHRNLQGNVTGDLTGNVTGDLTGNVTATSILIDGVTGTTQSSSDNSTKIATTAYVDTQAGLSDTLSEVLAIGNTTGATKISVDNTSGGIDFIDDAKARFGTGNDLEIYHNGSDSYIKDSGTGDVRIVASATKIFDADQSHFQATFVDGGSVDLYYSGNKKFATTSTGVSVTGALSTTTNISVGANATFVDNGKAIFGDGSDLQIYHDGSDSYISDTGTGDLRVDTNKFRIRNAGGTQSMLIATQSGGVDLYFNDSKKLETVATGVNITGNLSLTGDISSSGDIIIDNSSGDPFLKLKTSAQEYVIRIDQSESEVFQIRNITGATNPLTIDTSDNITMSGSLTIAQDLTVNGTTTTVNTQTLAVEDPLISLAKDNAANSVDIGFYGRYNDGSNRYLGLFADASDSNTFKLFKGTTTEPTTTVDITATGYALANLDVATLDATTGNFTSVVITKDSSNTQLKLKRIGSATGEFDIYTNTNSLYFGNVGTGTIPLYLDASDNATFNGDININGDDINFSTNGFADINNTGTGAIRLRPSSSTTALTISSSEATFNGNIVTSSSGGNKGIKVVTATDAEGFLVFGDSDDNSMGGLAYNNATDTLDIDCNNAVALSFDSSRNATFSSSITTSSTINTTGSGTSRLTDTAAYPLQLNRGLDVDSVGANGAILGIGTLASGTYKDGTRISGGLNANGTDGNFSIQMLSSDSYSTAITINSSVETTFNGNVILDSDTTKLKLGDNQDLQLYHDGSNSFIETTTGSAGDLYIKALGTGHDLYLRAADDINIQPQGGNNGIKVIGQGAVELYHNNSKKFETTSAGVEITNGTAGYSVISADGNGGVYSANGDVQFYTNNSAYTIAFYSANKGEKRLSISDDGNVSIPLGTRDTGGKGGALIVGGNADGNGTTTNTRKIGLITCPSYDNNDGNMAMFSGDTSDNTNNYLYLGSAYTGYSSPTDIVFKTTTTVGSIGSEAMRIKGGNVGIGTGADIFGDLHLEGGQQDIVLTNSSADGIAGLTISRIIGQARGYGNNGAAMQSIDFETNATNWFKGDIVFKTNNSDGTNPSVAATERMRIDSSGKVGIAITPSAWSVDALQVGQASISQDINSVYVGANTYNSAAGWKRINSQLAGYMRMGTNDGIWSFSNAITGAADSVITWNERMRITSGGIVQINTNTAKTNTSTVEFGSFGQSNETTNYSTLQMYTKGAASQADRKVFFQTIESGVANDGSIILQPSGGNVGIGIGLATAKLQIHNTNAGAAAVAAFLVNASTSLNTETRLAFAAHTNDNIATNRYSYISTINTSGSNGQDMIFATNATGASAVERMRITSGGNIQVANSVTGGTFTVGRNGNNESILVESDANNTSEAYIRGYSTGAGSSTFYVWSNGNVQNTNNSYGAISDVKLKENIVDATPKLDDLMKVKIRNYNLIGDDKKQIGVVAQELEDVFPNMIDESNDFEDKEITDEEGNVSIEKIDLGTTTKSVKYSVFVPMLIKAIQELKAEVDLLKQECKCKN